MAIYWTDEQKAFKETAERFAKEQLAPGYQERDVEGQIDRSLTRARCTYHPFYPPVKSGYRRQIRLAALSAPVQSAFRPTTTVEPTHAQYPLRHGSP